MFEVDRALIRQLYFKLGMSMRQFSRTSGLNLFTIRKLILGDKPRVSSKVLAQLAKYFGVGAEKLLLKNKADNGDDPALQHRQHMM